MSHYFTSAEVKSVPHYFTSAKVQSMAGVVQNGMAIYVMSYHTVSISVQYNLGDNKQTLNIDVREHYITIHHSTAWCSTAQYSASQRSAA